jgi:hypothetical protein
MFASLFFPSSLPTARQRAVMKFLGNVILGGHVFVLFVVALLLLDCSVSQSVMTVYHALHEASIPGELLYVLISVRLRTEFVPDDECFTRRSEATIEAAEAALRG